MKSEQAIFFLAASSNPHNDSEKLEIVVKALDITLSNGKENTVMMHLEIHELLHISLHPQVVVF